MLKSMLALYETMQILPEWEASVVEAVRKVRLGAGRYHEAYSPYWQFVGLVHLMECHCDFRRQILNGEKWNHVTTLTPVGLGPWESWKCSTIAAMNHTTIPIPLTWTTARILDRLERWNGLGYRQRGIASPYLWSGSNHGVGVGKFISDGKYDRHAVSAQVGAALVLREIW